MPMLPKASGGNRLIILYAGMHRIWQRARRWMISGIAESLGRKFWGAGTGRSATDCAWLQAARTEADRYDGMRSWMWVIGWPKYYESIPLRELKYKCLRVGIPTCWLKI
eukprot:8709848-Pyramimonas_sp.AAC.1